MRLVFNPFTRTLDDVNTTSDFIAGSTKQVLFNDGGTFGAAANLYWDKTNNRLGINIDTPRNALDVIGDFQVGDSVLAATKGYRFRTSGGNLDLDATGKDLFVSNFSGTSFGGSQYTYLRLESGVQLAHCIGSWIFTDGPFSGAKATIDGNTGLIYPVQAATASAPTYVKGALYFDTTLNKLRVGGATGWETVTSA
jgi:hypothetical protein